MTALLDDPRREAYLGLVPDALRNRATLALLRPLRDGVGATEAIYDAALAALRARLGRWGAEDPETRALLTTLLHHRAEALAFVAWLREWEALPRAEKERIKDERGAVYRRQWLDEQPPSPKQIASLRSLGDQGEIASKQHASEPIDHLRARRAS